MISTAPYSSDRAPLKLVNGITPSRLKEVDASARMFSLWHRKQKDLLSVHIYISLHQMHGLVLSSTYRGYMLSDIHYW